jgi:hypothetical protein
VIEFDMNDLAAADDESQTNNTSHWLWVRNDIGPSRYRFAGTSRVTS